MDLIKAAMVLAHYQITDQQLGEVYDFLYRAISSDRQETFYRNAQAYFTYSREGREVNPATRDFLKKFLIEALEKVQMRQANSNLADMGINLVNAKQHPNAAPLAEDPIVPRLEAFLQTATLSTVNYLPQLAELLDECADWIESLREEAFDEALSAVVLLQRAAKRSDLSKQAEILANAKDIMSTLTDLYLALKAPTGDTAIIEKGLTGNATADEILAAAKILGKGKDIQKLFEGKKGMALGVAKIKAKQALRDARDKKK